MPHLRNAREITGRHGRGGDDQGWTVDDNDREITKKYASDYAKSISAIQIERQRPRRAEIGDVVRRHAFHYCYDTAAELGLLNTLYALVIVGLNLFTATTKAIDRRSNKHGKKIRIYDKPRTPYHRVIDSESAPKPKLSGTLLIVAGIYGPVGALLPQFLRPPLPLHRCRNGLQPRSADRRWRHAAVAASLGASLGSPTIGLLLAEVSLVSLFATFSLPETRGIDLATSRTTAAK